MILSCIHKVLSSTIGNRLTGYAEKIICNYQTGFKTNREIIDNIHILRQTIEKAYDYNIQTYCL
jgi:hypothetical protein